MTIEGVPPNVCAVIAAAGVLSDSVAGIVAVAMVGSWAAGRGRTDSDVDLIVLTTAPENLLHDSAWFAIFDPAADLIGQRDFGAIEERRLRLPDGLEVEVGVGFPEWAATDPVDVGTEAVVAGGLLPLSDPHGVLAALLGAIR